MAFYAENYHTVYFCSGKRPHQFWLSVRFCFQAMKNSYATDGRTDRRYLYCGLLGRLHIDASDNKRRENMHFTPSGSQSHRNIIIVIIVSSSTSSSMKSYIGCQIMTSAR